MAKIGAFLKSMKWRWQILFTSQVFLGYLVVKWPPSNKDFLTMFLLFLIFGPLLYGGIYSINDILDLEADKKHHKKKNRPLASGKVTVHQLTIFSLALIGSALIVSYVLDLNLFLVCLLFIIVNLLYSMFFKRIPYLEIITNATTHPLRFLTGLIAAGYVKYINLIVILFLFALSIATFRRKQEIIENQITARKVLRYYTNPRLAQFLFIIWLIMFIFTIFQQATVFIISLIILFLNSIVVVGYHNSWFIRKIINSLC